MEFGISLKGDLDFKRTVALARQVEAAGFDYFWFADSHIIWSDIYTQMAVCMEYTDRLRFGSLVTNPKVRDWSVAASMFAKLAQISGGRFDMGVGRGDSSMRVMGKTPSTLAYLTEFCAAIRAMTSGESYQYEDCPAPVHLEWVDDHEIPIWIAAYGPRALKTAGEVGDGLVLQIADPGLCKWFTDQSIAAGKAAGRDMSNFRVLSCSAVWLGDEKTSIEQTSWFPAVVGNHVADIVEKHGKDSNLVPKSLTEFIKARKGRGADEGYNYLEHAVAGSDNIYYVTDEVTKSFCLTGPAEAHVAKIKALEAAGVTQVVLYLMTTEHERLVAEYAEHVMPHFK